MLLRRDSRRPSHCIKGLLLTWCLSLSWLGARCATLSGIPIVGPTDDLFLLVTITFLNSTYELVVVTFHLQQVVICQFAPFLFHFPLELDPFSFELFRIHMILLTCVTTLMLRPGRMAPNSTNWHRCTV